MVLKEKRLRKKNKKFKDGKEWKNWEGIKKGRF